MIGTREDLLAHLGLVAAAGPDDVRAALRVQLGPSEDGEYESVIARHFPELAHPSAVAASEPAHPSASDPLSELRRSSSIGPSWA